MPLTDVACKKALPREKPYKLSDAHGLHLLVKPSGRKYWRYKYRFLKTEKNLAIGVYPEVSLAEAREVRDQARKTLKANQDPQQLKKEAKLSAAVNSENTFEVIAREWHERTKAKWSVSHAKAVLHQLEKDVFPILGTFPIRDITPQQLLSTLRKIEQRGAYEITQRTRFICGQVFRYAIATSRAERDIAQDIKGALSPVIRGNFAAIDHTDLPAFLRRLNSADVRLFPVTRIALNLALLTFVRPGELINACWDEIDWANKRWVIPAHKMKIRKDHIVPLSKQVLELLEALKSYTSYSEFLFPHRSHPKKHMSDGAILKAIAVMGYKGKMTGHGFRSVAMSALKEQLNYRHEVIDRQLAHKHSSKIAAAYDRAMFLPERTKMMQEWANYIDSLRS